MSLDNENIVNYDLGMNLKKLFKKHVSEFDKQSSEEKNELNSFAKDQFKQLSKKNLAIPVKLYDL